MVLSNSQYHIILYQSRLDTGSHFKFYNPSIQILNLDILGIVKDKEMFEWSLFQYELFQDVLSR